MAAIMLSPFVLSCSSIEEQTENKTITIDFATDVVGTKSTINPDTRLNAEAVNCSAALYAKSNGNLITSAYALGSSVMVTAPAEDVWILGVTNIDNYESIDWPSNISNLASIQLSTKFTQGNVSRYVPVDNKEEWLVGSDVKRVKLRVQEKIFQLITIRPEETYQITDVEIIKAPIAVKPYALSNKAVTDENQTFFDKASNVEITKFNEEGKDINLYVPLYGEVIIRILAEKKNITSGIDYDEEYIITIPVNRFNDNTINNEFLFIQDGISPKTFTAYDNGHICERITCSTNTNDKRAILLDGNSNAYTKSLGSNNDVVQITTTSNLVYGWQYTIEWTGNANLTNTTMTIDGHTYNLHDSSPAGGIPPLTSALSQKDIIFSSSDNLAEPETVILNFKIDGVQKNQLVVTIPGGSQEGYTYTFSIANLVQYIDDNFKAEVYIDDIVGNFEREKVATLTKANPTQIVTTEYAFGGQDWSGTEFIDVYYSGNTIVSDGRTIVVKGYQDNSDIFYGKNGPIYYYEGQYIMDEVMDLEGAYSPGFELGYEHAIDASSLRTYMGNDFKIYIRRNEAGTPLIGTISRQKPLVRWINDLVNDNVTLNSTGTLTALGDNEMLFAYVSNTDELLRGVNNNAILANSQTYNVSTSTVNISTQIKNYEIVSRYQYNQGYRYLKEQYIKESENNYIPSNRWFYHFEQTNIKKTWFSETIEFQEAKICDLGYVVEPEWETVHGTEQSYILKSGNFYGFESCEAQIGSIIRTNNLWSIHKLPDNEEGYTYNYHWLIMDYHGNQNIQEYGWENVYFHDGEPRYTANNEPATNVCIHLDGTGFYARRLWVLWDIDQQYDNKQPITKVKYINVTIKDPLFNNKQITGIIQKVITFN